MPTFWIGRANRPKRLRRPSRTGSCGEHRRTISLSGFWVCWNKIKGDRLKPVPLER